MMNKNNGFTFTELMIVVSIIGVIASFMIPALVKTEPNEAALNYKKTFFALENAISNMVNDSDMYPLGDLRYNNTPIPAGATGDDITGYNLDTNSVYFCTNLADHLNTIGSIKCTAADGLTTIDYRNTENATFANMLNANTNFTLSNGVSIGGVTGKWDKVNDNTASNATIDFITLCIDINGEAEPNKGCAVADRANEKRDQFRIRLNYQGKVYTDSPIGPNNWYLENKMLINPRAVTKDKTPLTETEKTELVKAPGVLAENDQPAYFKTAEQCATKNALGYIWSNNLCVYTAGFTENKILRKKKKTE